jgi:hypothetical protein
MAAFLAGLVIIMDIIGPERLKSITQRSRQQLRTEDSPIRRFYITVAVILVVGLAVLESIRHPYHPSDELPGELSTNPWFFLQKLAQ